MAGNPIGRQWCGGVVIKGVASSLSGVGTRLKTRNNQEETEEDEIYREQKACSTWSIATCSRCKKQSKARTEASGRGENSFPLVVQVCFGVCRLESLIHPTDGDASTRGLVWFLVVWARAKGWDCWEEGGGGKAGR